MELMDFKEKLEILRRAGFTMLEIQRLYHFRRAYVVDEQDRSPVDLAHLRFIRWLVLNGRLTEELA